MFDFNKLTQLSLGPRLRSWVDLIPQQIHQTLDSKRHGDLERWQAVLAQLPVVKPSSYKLNADTIQIGIANDLGDFGAAAFKELLMKFHPWRKGPFEFFGVTIDTEWRSDWKWDRLVPHISSLAGRKVLDIGCGSGYHCWRMLAHFPEFVLGIEPSVLFNLQFQAIQGYLQQDNIHLLPIGVEAVPDDLGWFDTVFSMGVLYHRRSPLDHLYQLQGFLVAGGELCLETLVIEGGAGQVLLPRDRYARMRNVWFIPSSAELVAWLARCGFVNIRVVDESRTSIEEQRATEWMQFESLAQCLNPDDAALTVEGLPAPRRAVVLAKKPAG